MAEMTIEALHKAATVIGVPVYMQEALIQYILEGRPTGHFLTAVLSNDLKEAVARADEINKHALSNYVVFLYNYAPQSCWGSPENVKAWREHRGYQGLVDEAKAKEPKPESV